MIPQSAPSGGSAAAGSRSPAVMVPRINIQAFWETPQTAESVQSTAADRRMARAHVTVQPGGIPAAVRLFQTQSTPNLLIVESTAAQAAMMADLSSLAEVCQPDTKVIVIGQLNDVVLYRDLIRQGVSEYLVAPVAPLQLIETIGALYRSTNSAPLGRVLAFVGAKGGTGSSTLAHNCAWDIASEGGQDTALVDLDLAFGTAGLNFNQDTSSGILEALNAPERVDAQLLERLFISLEDRLNLLSGPGGLDREFLIEAHAVEAILSAMRASVPCIVADVPALWSPWVRFTLHHADEVIITAEPELASLRNTKSLVDMLTAARPNDPPPKVVLNQVGVAKRPEIAAADFKKAVGAEIAVSIPFDPQNFGAALNNGKMILQIAPKCKAAVELRKLSKSLVGTDKAPKVASSGTSLLRKITLLGKK